MTSKAALVIFAHDSQFFALCGTVRKSLRVHAKESLVVLIFGVKSPQRYSLSVILGDARYIMTPPGNEVESDLCALRFNRVTRSLELNQRHPTAAELADDLPVPWGHLVQEWDLETKVLGSTGKPFAAAFADCALAVADRDVAVLRLLCAPFPGMTYLATEPLPVITVPIPADDDRVGALISVSELLLQLLQKGERIEAVFVWNRTAESWDRVTNDDRLQVRTYGLLIRPRTRFPVGTDLNRPALVPPTGAPPGAGTLGAAAAVHSSEGERWHKMAGVRVPARAQQSRSVTRGDFNHFQCPASRSGISCRMDVACFFSRLGQYSTYCTVLRCCCFSSPRVSSLAATTPRAHLLHTRCKFAVCCVWLVQQRWEERIEC